MDKISDFFKEFKDRLSSPFFFSFLVSWCIFNWQIIIGLLFYKNTEVSLDGYHSFIDLIQNVTSKNTFWYPVLIALAYTFVIKNVHEILLAWTKNWGDKLIFRASKTSKISTVKYLELKNIYEKRTEALQEIIDKESITIQEKETLRNRLFEAEIANNAIRDNLLKYQQVNDYSIMVGEWEIHQKASKANEKFVEKISITSNEITFQEEPRRGVIINFYKAPDSNYLSFVIEKQKIAGDTWQIILFSLESMDNFRKLTGSYKSQDEYGDITFLKIK